MSILIEGMEMPYGCANCPFCGSPIYDSHGFATYVCNVSVEGICGKSVTNEVINMYDGGGAEYFPNWCPLVEVPTPHGRLIDADTLIQSIVKRLCIRSKEHFTHQESFVCAMIEDAPTVIPASEEEI